MSMISIHANPENYALDLNTAPSYIGTTLTPPWSVPMLNSARRLALAAGLLLVSGLSAAQANRPVNLMVPYPAGGLSDTIARIVEKPLAKALGQQVIVENLGGVAGAMGAQKVLSAPAEGGYLYQGSPNELILAPMALKAVKFKSEDFRLVQMIGAFPMRSWRERACRPRTSTNSWRWRARPRRKAGR